MKNQLNNILVQLGLIENNAVFFRNKDDGKTFGGFNSDTQKKQGKENLVHKQVWSFDDAPIVFIIKDLEIKVFNALNYSKRIGEEGGLQEIELSQDERSEIFSFWNLQSGHTWDWLQENYLSGKKKDKQKRVNERLFLNIKEVRETLIRSESNLTEEKANSKANSLILRLIFIRYLIDRGVKLDEKYIGGKTLNEKRLSFSQLIAEPLRLNELFKSLNVKFNGVLFKDIETPLTSHQAESLSCVFKGETPMEGSLFYNHPDFYFEVFDFSIIPVEVISGIYESLISPETRKLDSAVYTPSFLVEYILEDTVQKYLNDNSTSECKIFEVAVGSGIFLVQSLRKMIEKEKELFKNVSSDKFNERIREITKNNLFGIDINKEALKVTCFSIYIALLDYQNPKEIDEYEFPNLLGENLFEANFFDTNHVFNTVIKEQVKPNYILGNPPWKSNKDEIHTSWIKKNNKTIGRFEIAQSFLLRTKDFMLPSTKTALIVTSTIFYNVSKPTKLFKTEFLTTFCLDKFFDLSPVRRLIFEEKNSPASIVYYRLSDEDECKSNHVNHLSIKSNTFLKHFKTLVIEKFDQKIILQRNFIEYDWMFKVALYGNTLDFNLLTRVSNIKNRVIDLIDGENIHKGKGFFRGTPKKHFSFLEGLPILDNHKVKPFYTKVIDCPIFTYEDTYLESGRRVELFEGEHIYLKVHTKNESDMVVSYCEDTVVNRHDVITITSKDKIETLKNIYANLISNLYTYYQYLTSAAWGIGTRPAVRLEEQLSFPYPIKSEKLESEINGLVNNYLASFKEYYSEFKLGEPIRNESIFNQINEVINELYGVLPYEEDLINYVLDVSRYQFQHGKQCKFLRKVDNDLNFLKKYADVYLREFEELYQDEYMQVEVYSLNYFIAMNFVILDEKPEKRIVTPKKKYSEQEVLKRLANNLSISQITNLEDSTKNLFIQKDIKGFEKNSFYIIKPNEFKSWHRAMAWYDVAEFKKSIEEAEVAYIKGQS